MLSAILPLPLGSRNAAGCSSENDRSSKALVTLEIPKMEGLVLPRTFTRKVTHLVYVKLIILKTVVSGLHSEEEARGGS